MLKKGSEVICLFEGTEQLTITIHVETVVSLRWILENRPLRDNRVIQNNAPDAFEPLLSSHPSIHDVWPLNGTP